MFPPDPAAASAINWKDGYFVINGKPTFLTSGEMHYARIPRELWRDRIWRSKQMGFNCMQMYVFWNASEPKEGQWDFTDNVDLDAWLTMVQEAGMYAVVRVGPYSCAEWEHGGFPAWLTVKPGMTLRDSGPDFEKYSDAHLAQVEKIVAKHQINHGGSVLMVQLENEHPRGWGTDNKSPYLNHLLDEARKNGLEIPMFFSGQHHGGEPSGDGPYKVEGSPWYTTEFWTGWIGRYGDMAPGMLNEKVAGTWKIIAFGGGGYDYYMVHGGTNFGYSGTDNTDATYDYSAPIGETGQFHNLYYPARRAAWFARSFNDLLTGSHNDPTLAKADLPSLRVTIRTNPDAGSIVFIDKFSKKGEKPGAPEIPPTADAYQAPSEARGIYSTQLAVGAVTLPHQGKINVIPSEPRTVLLNIPWTNNAAFDSVCCNVLLRQTIGDTDYWVCYGPAGDSGEINLKFKQPSPTPAQIDFTFPTDLTYREIDLDSGDQHHAKVLVMNKELTNKTWFANGKLYVGPAFVTEDGSLEFPPAGGQATIYTAGGKSQVTAPAFTPADLPALTNWTWRDATTEAAADFPTTGWSQSRGPLAMGSDGFQNRYGWYRTTLHRDTAGPVNLYLAGSSGQFVTFLNGQPSDLKHLDCKAGDNSLAIFTKISPRVKLYGFTGPVLPDSYRGIWGNMTTDEPKKMDVAWKSFKGDGTADEFAKPDFNDSAWQPVDPGGKLTIEHGPSWVRGTFNVTPDDLDSFIISSRFANADTVPYLNGTQLDYTMMQDVSKILVPGRNVIAFRLSSWKGDTGTLKLSLGHNSPLEKATWYFHGGLTDLDETAIVGRVLNWPEFLSHSPWQTGAPATPNIPTLWRTTFTYHPPANGHETMGLGTNGLKTGHAWLNGHNLGECPQKVPLYMPECWLKDGDNDLVVFDVYGSRPDKVALSRFEAFSLTKGP